MHSVKYLNRIQLYSLHRNQGSRGNRIWREVRALQSVQLQNAHESDYGKIHDIMVKLLKYF